MPRKVFGSRCDRSGGYVRALVAVDLCPHQPGHQFGLAAEGAYADDRVGGVGVDVGDGREILVHAHRAQLEIEFGEVSIDVTGPPEDPNLISR